VVFGMVGGYVYLGREWEEGEKRPVLEVRSVSETEER
jgi:hypothetical protein